MLLCNHSSDNPVRPSRRCVMNVCAAYDDEKCPFKFIHAKNAVMLAAAQLGRVCERTPPPSLPSVLKPPRTTRRAARTKKNAATTQAQISIEQFKEELGRGNVVTLTRRTKQKKERQWKHEGAALKTVRAQKKPRRAATAFSVACVGRSRGRQQADGQAQAAGTTPRRRSSSCAAYPSGARCLHSSATYYPVQP